MLPEKFKERMKELLGDEYPELEKALTEGDAVRGARINRLKVTPELFFKHSELKLQKAEYVRDGYILTDNRQVGSLPEHHSGMIYMQDPGAMASLASVDIPSGAYVLDMCAAPGGKSGQAAAMIGEDGFLFANEYVPKRAKITVSNFERLGIKNAMVTSLDTAELKKLFSGFFDFIIADVPCSGEGMFRKSEEALADWSEENVLNCARRQKEILENAASLVKDGGHIIYSTCTYSVEENEDVVMAFLENHPEFSLAKPKDELINATRGGICAEKEKADLMRRFYPHISPGEGQFVALLRKDGNTGGVPEILYKDSSKPLSREESAAVADFFKKHLKRIPDATPRKVGENIVLIPHGLPVPPFSVFSAGVLLGEVKKGLLTPAHQFFSAYGELFCEQVELSDDKVRLEAYLRGEEIAVDAAFRSGWCSVCYGGATLGGGKISSGRMKNHYPKGLRNK